MAQSLKFCCFSQKLILCFLPIAAIADTGFVTQGIPNTIATFSTTTGEVTNLSFVMSSNFPAGIALSKDGATAFVVNQSGNTVSVFSTATGGMDTPFATGFNSPYGIALSKDGATAFVVNNGNATVSAFPTVTGGAAITFATGFMFPTGIALSEDGATAFVTNNNSQVYTFPTAGPPGVVATANFANNFNDPHAIAISKDGATAFVANTGNNTVSSFPTAGPPGVAATTLAMGFSSPIGIALSEDGATAFVVNSGDNTISTFSTSATPIVTASPFASGFTTYPVFIAILPPSPSQIMTQGLKGNNLTVANYLNSDAPLSTRQLFISLSGSTLSDALMKTDPLSNTDVTYAAGIAQLSLSNLLDDHLRGNRAHLKPIPTNPKTIAYLELNDLLAGASNKFWRKKPAPATTPARARSQLCQSSWSPWLGVVGAMAREKAQHQTPEFNMGIGGLVAAVDYSGSICPHSLGVGMAYVHTYIHKDQGTGHANVDQGYLLTYSTLKAADWYFDLGLWGGYYYAHNLRKVSFPGFSANAKSTIHGWQLVSHLEIGYDDFTPRNWDKSSFGIEPFSMIDWINSWEHGVRERGADVLNMGQEGRHCSFLRSETGLRFHEMMKFNWGRIAFLEKGSYAYQKAFHIGTLTAFLVGSPGSFSVSTLTKAQNLGIGEFEMLFLPANKKIPTFSLSYQGEFGSLYQSHQAMLIIAKYY